MEYEKFVDWYTRTLDSYQHFFGQKPPQDIWPTPADRFGQELEFVRINLQRSWLLPKPSRIQSLGACLQLFRRQ